MNWIERLKALRSLAKQEQAIERFSQEQERELQRQSELLERKVRSGVEKVCKAFARNVGWRLSTDTEGFAVPPNKVYLEPKLKPGERAEARITVGIDSYNYMVTVELPPWASGPRPVAIPFQDFTEERLTRALERFYKASLSEEEEEAEAYEEEREGTLSLGWYYSERKDQFQMAKIAERDRATHMYVIGATGSGKTKFLEFLIQQDIEKGNGFGIIDPHGDLIEDVKGFLACYHHNYKDKEIFDRVVLIDPTDPEFTVTFNPLERLPNVSVAEQASEFVAAFKKTWDDSWGVRMEDLLRNSLIALGEAGLTLTQLPAFLTRRALRRAVLEKVTHPVAKEYFQMFETLTDRGQVSWMAPVMTRVNAFFANERIRQIFSSPQSSFDLRKIMDEGKILLVNLDKGKLKGSADLLGSLLLAKIQMAAFSRSDIPQHRRRPFYLYVDEFQNFASDSFMVFLSEARKYGLSLIMAHQTLAQIPEELRSLILGNAGIQVYFRVNRKDAQLLAKEAFEYSGYEVKAFHYLRPIFWTLGEEWEHYTEALQSLPPRACYVKHKIEGGIIPIQTVEIQPAWEALGMGEEEYQEYLKGLPLGKRYLVPRSALSLAPPLPSLLPAEEEVKKEERPAAAPPPAVKEREETKRKEPIPSRKEAETGPSEAKVERQHRYLQSLIKRMAEAKGYRAVIEEPTPDGGRVDVGLQLAGRRIACEITITTSGEQELSNIEKCLRAGYHLVILCSPEKKTLDRLKALLLQKVAEANRDKLLFLQPEELFSYLEAEAAKLAGKEERVKGYKVKVQYQPVEEEQKKAKRQAIAQIILQSLRRQREKGPK
jgi:hypothetical protein